MSTTIYFQWPSVLARLHAGALSGFIDGYAARCAERGYAHHHAACRVHDVGVFSRWLGRRRLSVQDINEARIQVFLTTTTERLHSSRRTLLELLADLRSLGVAPEARTVPVGRRERALADYGRFLADERGLAPRTVELYLEAAAVLADAVASDDGPRWQALTPRVIQDLVRATTRTCGSAVVQQFTVGLRSVLRYLRLRGVVSDDLVRSVPTVAHWRLSDLPRCLSGADVDRVIEACDHDGVGRRNRAVLLLLARLGLRAHEVACLSLDDLDWRAGVLNVNGKGGDRSLLPLSDEVGRALADYLGNGRPTSTLRFVFLRHIAPHGRLDSSSVTALASRAIHRAGLRPPRTGAHVFRHSLATRLLGAGASLAEVGQVLRHRHEDTTRLYAKVDLDRLRTIAPVWPGSAS